MRQDHTSQDHTSCLGFSAPIDATEIMSIDPTSMAIDSTSAGTSPDSTTPLASEPHRVVSTLAIREKHGPHDPQSQQPKSGSTGAQNDLFNHSKKRPAEEDLDAGPSAKLTKSSSTPKPILRPPPPPPPPTPENIFSIFYMEINLLKLKVPPSQLERLESIEGALRSLLKTMTREGKLKRGELRCIFALAQALQHHDFDGVNERKADVLWIFRWKYRPYYVRLIHSQILGRSG